MLPFNRLHNFCLSAHPTPIKTKLAPIITLHVRDSFNRIIEVCKQSLREVKEINNTNNNSKKAQHVSEKLKENFKGEWFVSIADTSNNNFDFKCTMVEAKNVITLLYNKQMEIYIFPLGKVISSF